MIRRIRRARPAAALICALALLITGCGTGAPPEREELCAPGAVQIGGSGDDLQNALDAAAPGDVLQLADGAVVGRFTITVSGTAERPITLCGSAASVLDGGSTADGYTLHLDGASHWVLDGFAVAGAAKGIMLDRASHNELRGLTVSGTGHEGIHLRTGSSGNTVRDSLVHDTGRVTAEYGEGIYIGSAESNWCRYTDCEPDESDDNVLVGNTVRDTTAEAIDVKEGTTGGTIRGNSLSISADAVVDSVIDLKGNGWDVDGNDLTASALAVEVQSIVDGWGQRNRVTGNTLDAPADSPVILVAASAREGGNTVGCDNVLTSGEPARTNVPCT